MKFKKKFRALHLRQLMTACGKHSPSLLHLSQGSFHNTEAKFQSHKALEGGKGAEQEFPDQVYFDNTAERPNPVLLRTGA